MRISIIALVLCFAPGLGLAQTPGPSVSDEEAVRRVVQQHEDARHRSDWKAMALTFTADADQLTSAGEWRHGRDEIERGVAQAFAGNYSGGTYTGRIDAVRMLSPSVALVNGNYEIGNIGNGGARRGYTTFVVVREANAWLIAAVRWMVPTAAGAVPAR